MEARNLGFIELQGANNVRDLGGIPVCGGRRVKPGLIYRGGNLHGITNDDAALLFGARDTGGLGIRCVIDLRTGWEREEKPDRLPAANAQVKACSPSDTGFPSAAGSPHATDALGTAVGTPSTVSDASGTPCTATAPDAADLAGAPGAAGIPGTAAGTFAPPFPIEALHIPFFDQDIVGIDYKKPLPGTEVQGNDFACDPDDFYRAMLNPLTVGQMRRGVAAVLERAEAGMPVLYHCSGGKDRAGVLSVLVLTVLGADRDAILEDYLQTNIARDRDIDRIYARFLRLVGDEEWAREITWNHRARPENLAAVYEEIDTRYGSMDRFVEERLSLSPTRIAHLRRTCTE